MRWRAWWRQRARRAYRGGLIAGGLLGLNLQKTRLVERSDFSQNDRLKESRSFRISRLRNSCLVGTKVGLFFGVDSMSDAGWLDAAMQAEDPVTNCQVRRGESFPLTEIINP